MKIFKEGDKVVFSNTNGDSYGIGEGSISSAKKHKFLTIKAIDLKYSLGRIWFKEVGGYWNISWFKKFDTQLEFDFVPSKPKR